MQKERYINQNQQTRRKFLAFTISVFIVFLLILIIILNQIKNNNREYENAVSTGNFTSIKQILEYYGCKFIKVKNSSAENYLYNIYTNFKVDLYQDENSNEDFYNNLINEIAKFYNYNSNFQMIDESRNPKIEIQVICDGSKINKIYINGIEDYFIYMNSQIELKKYKELKNINLSIDSPELNECIQNNWSKDIDFGTRENIFQNYYVYFDEGIEVRKISGKIYNIVFTEKYKKNVVNGFTVGTNYDIIIRGLGNPTFQNEDKSIIGYKSKDIYVFFEKNQISVYRNIQEVGFDEFFELVDSLLDNNQTLLEFMNELTYIWPDYEEYTYNEETVFLSYPNKGIDVKINYDNTDGIVVYNNIGISQDMVNKYLKNTEFIAMLQVDNVYNAEVRRYNKIQEFSSKCEKYSEEFEKDNNRNHGSIYDYYMKMSENNKIICAYFISNNSDFPNSELSENIDTYIWLNEYCFLYSIKNKGIYYYDLKNQTKGILLTGKEEYKIKSYKNNILEYDNERIQLQY